MKIEKFDLSKIMRLSQDWATFLVKWNARIRADDLTSTETLLFNREARVLGLRINDMHGMESMAWFHRYTSEHCCDGFARGVELAWDGIGDWRG